jgi:transposase
LPRNSGIETPRKDTPVWRHGQSFRAYLPEQDLLLPPNLRDWLPESHLAHFVSDVADQLDLSAIESVYEKDERGQPPYRPRMMAKILLYGYCVGLFSSRQMQKKLVEDVGFRMLAAGINPISEPVRIFGAASGGTAGAV